MDNNNIEKLKKISRNYILARKKFRKIADLTPELAGNDNLIGRIGEFIALQFLRETCNRTNVVRNKNIVEAGYDILADNKKVSVKIITSENIRGFTTHVRNPWDELVLIELDGSEISRIGLLEKEALLRQNQKPNPIVKRTMLSDEGIIMKYGKVYSGNEVKRYL